MLVNELQKDLKQWHDDMVYHKLLDNDPMFLVAGSYLSKVEWYMPSLMTILRVVAEVNRF